MTCRLWWYGRNRNRKSNSSMADVLGKWNGMSSQSHMPHCRVLPSAKFSVMSSQSHVPPCRVLPPGESWTEANPSKKHNFGQLLTMWKTSLFHCKISWPHWIDSGRLFTNAGHTYTEISGLAQKLALTCDLFAIVKFLLLSCCSRQQERLYVMGCPSVGLG